MIMADDRLLGSSFMENSPGSGLADTPVERGSSDEIWRAENRATMDAWNDYIATHGIPYAEYRRG
jgi:hypothetical protein